ncbi:uncharacterized protein LOC124326513 [Daphnia pulicaria]|uniref:uncharacterized protein LOC124326513 n=1 Tax=Daphnia pulicaria TaxID=35523 RepID=UPI001EEC6032|nr:uncharacterized protein LOC124326513 [Daphnia pulicaria]XP_046641363.1 uncharacterized protein LOC124326513 [Daphnia pulicaria]
MTFGVGHSPLFIQGSNWAIENIIEVPMDSVLGDPAFVYVNVFSLIFRIVIQLERLFVKKKKTRSSRKIGEDQHAIFKSLERSLQTSGIDGRACLLRAICEMQQVPFNHYSIMGEILTALFTPKRGAGNMMQEYLEAEKLGQADAESCASAYYTCPVSLFKMMRTYSTPADKPHDHHHNGHHARDEQEKGRRVDSEVPYEESHGIFADDPDGLNHLADKFRVDMF